MNSTIYGSASACARHAMKEFSVLRVFWIIGLAAAFSLTFPQHAFGVVTPTDDTSPVVPVVSLSGVLFYDKDHDLKVDNNADWAIPCSVVELYKDNIKVDETKTNCYGQYFFQNLTPGNYGVRNTVTGNFMPVTGQVLTIKNEQKVSGLGEPDDEKDGIYNISLSSGDSAYLYNFAAAQYPIQLLSKRMLLASAPEALIHTVPEPSTAIMLICACITIGAGTVCRRYFLKK